MSYTVPRNKKLFLSTRKNKLPLEPLVRFESHVGHTQIDRESIFFSLRYPGRRQPTRNNVQGLTLKKSPVDRVQRTRGEHATAALSRSSGVFFAVTHLRLLGAARLFT